MTLERLNLLLIRHGIKGIKEITLEEYLDKDEDFVSGSTGFKDGDTYVIITDCVLNSEKCYTKTISINIGNEYKYFKEI